MSLSKLQVQGDEADNDFDWNSAAKSVVRTGLGYVPVVGGILSGLVGIFWPSSSADIWAEMKEKVEALINQKISELVYKQVQDSLKGLNLVINDYLNAAKIGSPSTYLSEKWNAANAIFLYSLPSFQSEGYEVLLLPLFAQYCNLFLSLLHDGAIHGKDKMGWNDLVVDDIAETLRKRIDEYTKYVCDTYQKGLDDTKATAPHNDHECQPFKTVNRYEREMTLAVVDHRDLWQYFNPTKYPPPVKDIYLDREIYTDPVGTADDTGIKMPGKPSQPISKITVWGWDRIDACQVDYPSGGGPDGVTSTGRMGNRSGGDIRTHGGSFDLTTRGPIVAAAGKSGHILNAWWFHFKDGSVSNKMGGNYHGGGQYKFQFEGEILSSIRIMGVSRFYGSTNCVVYGFKYEKDAAPTPQMLQLLHETSPQQHTAKQILAMFPGHDYMLADVERMEKEYDWEGKRSQHWIRLAESKS